MSYDLIVKNGRVMDGSGNPWFHADIGVEDGLVAAVGNLGAMDAKHVVDARGMIVAPGFIDIHSHSDVPILIDRRGLSKIHQGVTTEVVGQCGNSAAPVNEPVREYREKYARSSVPEDFHITWGSMASYMDEVDKGAALNIAPLVGHGTVRQDVMGYENREPTADELEDMRKLVAEAMMDGAWGMSTGLIYPPSVYGKTPEIVELAKVVTQFGGLYFSHIRGEGDTLLEAVEEACEIGLQAGLPVQISHFKASGQKNWGKTVQSLALVEEYRGRGVDVTFDQYPYVASSTGLTALLPHWAHEGGVEKMLEHLKSPSSRKRMKKEQRLGYPPPENILVTKAKNNPQYTGKNLKEIGEMMGKKPFDAMFDLLIAENTQVPSVMFGLNEEDVVRVMRSPFGMVGSDASAICPEGVWADSKPHPRAYGTFPRVLGKYVREGVISLQEAVRKMTGAPAQRMGFKDRGLLKEGYKADITVFDPATVRDEATFTDPQRYASGIHHVVVKGVLVIEDGEYTGALPGKALRKPV